MAIVSVASLITIGGIVWKYHRIPLRFYQWHKAAEVDPAVGQIWREANFSPVNTDWKITEVDDQYISVYQEVDEGEDTIDVRMDWEAWAKVYVGKRRVYCADLNNSVEDTYWGEHSED